jgi:hypothetical protein
MIPIFLTYISLRTTFVTSGPQSSSFRAELLYSVNHNGAADDEMWALRSQVS